MVESFVVGIASGIVACVVYDGLKAIMRWMR